MTRALAASPIALLAFVGGACARRPSRCARGLVSDDAVTLWAGAISAGDGEVPIGRIVASYPTMPFLATTLLELITPSGTPTPALLAAGCWRCWPASGSWRFAPPACRRLAAAPATLLIALHPAMLAACLAGAAEMFLAAFLYLLGNALFDLRARTAAPEVMTVGLALLGLSFSHPIGAAIAVAVLPRCRVRGAPDAGRQFRAQRRAGAGLPDRLRVGAFAYVSWVFPGSGWSFLAAPAESLAGWAADAATDRSRSDRLARARRRRIVTRGASCSARRSRRSCSAGSAAPAAGRPAAGVRRRPSCSRPRSRSRPACSAVPPRSRSPRRCSPP